MKLNISLNENEEKVLALIKNNPFIPQQELANQVELSRSAVANIISSLVEKDYLLGKAYVVNENQQIVCIGGANVDRKIHSQAAIQPYTSNPANSSQSVGGVARNIAENLGRLGWPVAMLTVAGKDADFNLIRQESEHYMDLSFVEQKETVATGSYTAVLDDTGNLFVALADMDAYQLLTPELFKSKEKLLRNAKCIIADLNCSSESLEYLLTFGKELQKPVIFIPVSSPKIKNLPKDLSGLTWLITNCDESETYFNCKIKSQADWQQVVEKWLALGIENVIVTKGTDGALAGNQQGERIHQPALTVEHLVDVTGAGDAFCAAIVDAWLDNHSLKEALQQATVNSVRTIESSFTVRPELSKNQLLNDMEELIK
ncbi:pseudouridine kinase [Enterococcus sp. PF1-24]|uniref:carbohydrate kinase n=1 Tax=unclassified Enterococcus TaxID=2608891 RepID=UPI0024749533|nr:MULTISPECIES: carbohydrate kinase [unclassified Enterococcus]MDH6363036.1 pseudouridine kinase [Enterococcus sp. PFB1-1]MDH6400130.1 pseudouridine kinase [Enterococcus sp. PF1-24]